MAGIKSIALFVGFLFCVVAPAFAANSAEMEIEWLHGHNVARQQHQNTPDVAWSSQLQMGAAKQALKLADANAKWLTATSRQVIMSHTSDRSVGENIFIGNNGKHTTQERTIQEAVSAWYAEGVGYNYNSVAPFGVDWHFTQIVWKSTLSIGCAKAGFQRNDRHHTIFVCQYSPAGNISIGFIRNVMRLKTEGKDRLSPAELVPIKTQKGACIGAADTGPPGGCVNMKNWCFGGAQKELSAWLLENCKKTCYC